MTLIAATESELNWHIILPIYYYAAPFKVDVMLQIVCVTYICR